MDRKTLIKYVVIAAVGIGVLVVFASLPRSSDAPANNVQNSQPQSSNNSSSDATAKPAEEIIAQNLKIPWEIAFLPSGDMLVTERIGKLHRFTPNKVAINIEGVAHVGEGGLLGLAVHPNFKDNNFVYLYLTTRSGNGLVNRVERYRLNDDQLSDKRTVLEGVPGASNHDGGRIAFGPDGYLYITTGDAEQSSLAQDTNSLAGKILRLKDDGSVPSDNPFGNAVYSYGHRNPQGLAWDDQGRLWATEHGPSGLLSGHDELNRIEKGKNYGWPTIKGDQTREGMVTPVANSGFDDTWAPSGLAFFRGTLFFAGLRGQALYAAKIKADGGVDLRALFKNKYGRLRSVVVGPDSYIYISTSNTDGRGHVEKGDDKIVRLAPSLFQ